MLQNLNEYFLPLSGRREKSAFSYRINGGNEEVLQFSSAYFQKTRQNGVTIEGRLQNPTETNLQYYDEMIGIDFRLDSGFITQQLKKWLPRMNEAKRVQLTGVMLEILQEMATAGKNENILKNAYTKYMCWLYYKFEQILAKLGNDEVSKILFVGEVNQHELNLFYLLAVCGADVVLLQTKGEGKYASYDKNNRKTTLYLGDNLQPFAEDFSFDSIKNQVEQSKKKENLKKEASIYSRNTNQWIKTDILENVLLPNAQRGNTENVYNNCFMKMIGVENKALYHTALYQFMQKLNEQKRTYLLFETGIPLSDTVEINAVKRGNYKDALQMIHDMASNLVYPSNPELQKLIRQEFIEVMLAENEKETLSLNKLMNTAVYLICWFRRYQERLLMDWKIDKIPPLCIFFGAYRHKLEPLFLVWLSRLPVDVLILCPNGVGEIVASEPLIFEQTHEYRMELNEFPKEESTLMMGTTAFHAEQELNEMMYEGDSGMYRNYQFEKATTVTLQTMYEEIAILWSQDGKFRPNFTTIDNKITLPVIFAKVCGVKDGDVKKYWHEVKKLVTADTYVIPRVPFFIPDPLRSMTADVHSFLYNGQLVRDRITGHKNYQYGHLRDEMQTYIFDKIQLLIDRKSIKGTGENGRSGAEYTILSTLLTLNIHLVRLLQKFDFTKALPKVLCIDTTESQFSLEDSIVLAFLNLVGFDVLIFTPTGYQNIERHFAKPIMKEHQIGEYMYELTVPKLESATSVQGKSSWKNLLFGKGS
ncbi:MAG: YceG family protein [Bacillota bacterium]